MKVNPRILGITVIAAAALALSQAGCGGADPSSSLDQPSITDQAASALDLTSDDDDGARGPGSARYSLDAVLYRLRSVAAPLFQHYGVSFSDDWEESRAVRVMLSQVSVVVHSGVVLVTNKTTGGVIFKGSLNNLSAGVFSPENIPGSTTTPPPACAYTTGAWGACQADGTQSRTVTASPSGCTGTAPASTQACTYVPPVNSCTAFTYSAWSTCSAAGQQSRTVTASTPAGCTGGNPVLTQACTPSPVTCTAFTYSAWGTCSAAGQQSRTVTASTPVGCSGGTPVLTQACTPPPVTCTSFTYSAWGTCSAAGQQTRAVSASAPTGCTGGTPVLSQACTPPPPPIDGGALYTQYCASCHGTSKKGSAAATIQNAINSNKGGMGSLSFLTPEQVTAISLAP